MSEDDAALREGSEDAGSRRPTLHDVARESGVSTSTAARVLSGNGQAAASTRDRVLDASKRLGYVPNAVARGLRSQSTNLIGVLIADLGNAFYAELAAGAEDTLRTRGYQMLLADSDGGRPEIELSAAQTFQSMQIDGLIITPSVPTTGIREDYPAQRDARRGGRQCHRSGGRGAR